MASINLAPTFVSQQPNKFKSCFICSSSTWAGCGLCCPPTSSTGSRSIHRRNAPTMLRVQKKRRPEDWEKKKSTLSGRFLPMDPRDEAILDLLENKTHNSFLDFVPPSSNHIDIMDEYDDERELSSSGSRKWSKRSEAARKRWSDPEYRAKMLEKRADKRRRDQLENSVNGDGEGATQMDEIKKLEIGCMDSITLSDESKAQAINAYAKSNKLRSEKITAFHRNKKVWMEERLQNSPQNLSDNEYIRMKADKQERRRQAALKRARIKREKQAGNHKNGSRADVEDSESTST